MTQATRYRTAFPDFLLDIEIPAGFEDVSYRNDACPSWVNKQAGLHLFVDYQNPGDREIAGPRFILSEYKDDVLGDVIVETDNFDLIRAASEA